MSRRRAVVVRTLQATPERVFHVCSDPALIARWIGPTAFTATQVEVDLRVGGRYLFRMRTDGGEYAATGTYLEVSPPRRIVMTWAWTDAPDLTAGSEPIASSVVTFDIAPAPEGSTLTLTHAYAPGDANAEGYRQGWGETLDKLAALIASG